jgi:hypothetical protein
MKAKTEPWRAAAGRSTGREAQAFYLLKDDCGLP